MTSLYCGLWFTSGNINQHGPMLSSTAFIKSINIRCSSKLDIHSCYQHLLPINTQCISRVTRSLWFVILNLTFVAKGCHSSLWPEATTFKILQRAYLWPKAVTVCCGPRPQHLKCHQTGTF